MRGYPLRLSTAAFQSDAYQIHLLSWVSMELPLFESAKSIDPGLISSRIDFGTQVDERHLVPCAECWCECLHEVLFCLVLWALALTALTFFLLFCFDWMDDWLAILLWLFLSKKFSYFLSALSAIWQKVLSCKELWRHSWWHWLGTHIALSAFFTTSFFISDDVMIDLAVKQAAGMNVSFRQAGRCC